MRVKLRLIYSSETHSKSKLESVLITFKQEACLSVLLLLLLFFCLSSKKLNLKTYVNNECYYFLNLNTAMLQIALSCVNAV